MVSDRLGGVMFDLILALAGLLFLAYIIRTYFAGKSSGNANSTKRYGSGERDASMMIASGQISGYESRRDNHDADALANSAAHQLDRPSEHARLDDAFAHLGSSSGADSE